MSKTETKVEELELDVLEGPHNSYAICIGYGGAGHRVAGPRMHGQGKVVRRLKVKRTDLEEALRMADSIAAQREERTSFDLKECKFCLEEKSATRKCGNCGCDICEDCWDEHEHQTCAYPGSLKG